MAPGGNHRRVIVFGTSTDSRRTPVAVHLDFSSLTTRQCVLDQRDESRSDFERWSPSQQREEPCLFGRQMWFWRRRRDRQCTMGDRELPVYIEHDCACTASDFECEYNHYRDSTGNCVLYPGAVPLNTSAAEQCWTDESDGFWYDRTNVRKIPYSSCTGGQRPDRGKRHRCPARPASGSGVFLWIMVLLVPVAAAFMFARWYIEHSGAGFERLSRREALEDIYEHAGLAARFAGGAVSAFVARVREAFGRTSVMRRPERPFSSYHMLAADEDAEMLDDYDERE